MNHSPIAVLHSLNGAVQCSLLYALAFGHKHHNHHCVLSCYKPDRSSNERVRDREKQKLETKVIVYFHFCFRSSLVLAYRFRRENEKFIKQPNFTLFRIGPRKESVSARRSVYSFFKISEVLLMSMWFFLDKFVCYFGIWWMLSFFSFYVFRIGIDRWSDATALECGEESETEGGNQKLWTVPTARSIAE